MLLLKKSLQGLIWCGREDSNFHGCYPTATSTLEIKTHVSKQKQGLMLFLSLSKEIPATIQTSRTNEKIHASARMCDTMCDNILEF